MNLKQEFAVTLALLLTCAYANLLQAILGLGQLDTPRMVVLCFAGGWVALSLALCAMAYRSATDAYNIVHKRGAFHKVWEAINAVEQAIRLTTRACVLSVRVAILRRSMRKLQAREDEFDRIVRHAAKQFDDNAAEDKFWEGLLERDGS